MLRDDIPGIVKCFYANSKARSITIPTNAFFTDKIVEAVKKILKDCPLCLLNVSLSLDGIGPDHDRIRGLRGGFKRLLETHQALLKIREQYDNFYIKITTVLSKYNKDFIGEVIDYVRDNLDIDDHELLLARGNTRERDAVDVSLEMYRRTIKKINENAALNLKKRKYQFSRVFYGLQKYMYHILYQTLDKKRPVYPCLAGRRLIEIFDNGDVAPCEMLQAIDSMIDPVMGNIRDYDYNLRELLNSKKAGELIKHIRDSECCCTFECSIFASTVFNPSSCFDLMKNMVSLSK